MKQTSFQTFILFWLTQSISQLGSAMTAFALTIWAYTQTNSAMAVSLMAFCTYIPYVLVSVLSGSLIDRHKKKSIMAVSDSVAAVCTVVVMILYMTNNLQLWQIYVINSVLGLMNAFQSPAQSVAVGILVPEEKMAKASGMDSFSTNLVTVISPMTASAIYGILGMGAVLLIDLASFVIAFMTLILKIQIPEHGRNEQKRTKEKGKKRLFTGYREGMQFCKQNQGLWHIIITMAVINFFSRLTYENILSPMLLARSGNNTMTLSLVTSILGLGGVLGAILITLTKKQRNPVKMMYFSAAISFLLGDLLMGVGQNTAIWCIAALAASIPIPYIVAGQRVIMYRLIPKEIQGRIFSVRNAIQFSTIPFGIVLGGFLADYVFEPWMKSGSKVTILLGQLVGTGNGSGMAVMFLCTGILGSVSSILAYRKKEVQQLAKEDF